MTAESQSKDENIGQDIIESIRMRLETEVEWQVIEDYTENLALGANIRERSQTLVEELAKGISSQGQLQECTGDTLPDGTHRLIAGQHRYWAVEQINSEIDKFNGNNPNDLIERMKLRVRVTDHELPPFRMLEIQIIENLHKDMEPEEEANAIDGLYHFYKQVFEDDNVSVADFARRIGRGETKVRNAIRFMGMEERVRNLVEQEALLYSVAVKLTKLEKDAQFAAAMKIILYNLSGNKIDTFIRSISGDGPSLSLFSGEIEKGLEEMNFKLAYRGAADKAAKDAAGYFKRVITILEILEEPEKLRMTDTIRDILATFIASSDEFKDELYSKTPHLWEILVQRANEVKQRLVAKN